LTGWGTVGVLACPGNQLSFTWKWTFQFR